MLLSALRGMADARLGAWRNVKLPASRRRSTGDTPTPDGASQLSLAGRWSGEEVGAKVAADFAQGAASRCRCSAGGGRRSAAAPMASSSAR